MLQQHIPLHTTDYALPSDQDCIDSFSPHAHHPATSYNSNGQVEPLRRDGSLAQQQSSTFGYSASNGTPANRYVPDRNVASDAARYVYFSYWSSAAMTKTAPQRHDFLLGGLPARSTRQMSRRAARGGRQLGLLLRSCSAGSAAQVISRHLVLHDSAACR